MDTVARAAKKGAGDEETGSSGAASALPRLSAAPIAAPAPKEGERKGPKHARTRTPRRVSVNSGKEGGEEGFGHYSPRNFRPKGYGV